MNRAFTLIEMLIAILLTAIVFTYLYATLDNVRASHGRYEKAVEGVSEAELKKVQINTKADFIFSMENSSNVADLFGSYLARGDIEPLLHYEENIDKLTPDMIKTVAKKYLDPQKATTVILRKGEK